MKDSFLEIEHRLRSQKNTAKKIVFLLWIAAPILAVWLICNVLLGSSAVTGDALMPDVAVGDLAVFRRIGCNYTRGMLVAAETAEGNAVMRIEAKSGDIIERSGENGLVCNGIFLENSVEELTPFFPALPYTLQTDEILLRSADGQLMFLQSDGLLGKIVFLSRIFYN